MWPLWSPHRTPRLVNVDRIRILLVDDVEELRQLVAIQLRSEPRFEVVGEAGDGSQAIERAAELQPDAVLLDIAMPVMDGLKALPEIHIVAPNSKVIMFSAFTDTKTRTRALALSAHAYIEKGMGQSFFVGQVTRAYDAPAKAPQSFLTL
jgi:DNA-binding NarL/FixJ family response regulator